jgi:serine protease Do
MRNKNFLSLLAAVAAFAAAAQDDFTVQALQGDYDRVIPAICQVLFTQEVTDPRTGETVRRNGTCLGLIVRADGLVMAQGHLSVENAIPVDLRVKVGRGGAEKEYPAVALHKPGDVNVMFLQAQSDTPLNLPHVTFTPQPLRVGEPVALVGLTGETLDFEPGVFVDRVAAVLTQPRTTYCLANNLRFGCLTGPVVNARGNLVGVAGVDLSRADGGELYTRSGHPLVYQAELFQKYIDTPPEREDTHKAEDNAWLGVFTQPLKDDYAEYWGLEKTGGLVVSTVVPNSPAANAGVQAGDVIKAFDGKPQRFTQDRDVLAFTKLVRDTGTGKTVPMDLLRDGKPLTVQVTLGTLPRSAQEADEFEDAVLGLSVREITRDVRITLNIAEDVRGVIVRKVKSGSVAQVGKMRPGVILLALGDYPVASIADFEAAMAKLGEAKPAELAVFARVGPQTGFFRLKPKW